MSIKINNLMEIKDCKEAILIEFAKEFIFNSNNIEGSKIPAEEVKKIIESGNSRYQNSNEVREVYNSIDAMRYVQKGFKFNISSIKKLYYILTKDLLMQTGEPYPKGFKTIRNVVNNMETIPPELVIPKLNDLLDRYKKNKRQTHPLKLAIDFHLTYEHIHPFLDGNGRTGRLIMNKILMSQKYFPIIVYSKNSRSYFNSISKGLSGKYRKKYYQFMLEQVKKTYENFISIIEKY
jgi:Fic family protein